MRGLCAIVAAAATSHAANWAQLSGSNRQNLASAAASGFSRRCGDRLLLPATAARVGYLRAPRRACSPPPPSPAPQMGFRAGRPLRNAREL